MKFQALQQEQLRTVKIKKMAFFNLASGSNASANVNSSERVIFSLGDNIATSLVVNMRSALANTSMIRSWDYEAGADNGTKELIRAFAEKIDDLVTKVTTNAEMLLDEIELHLSSPINFTDSIIDVAASVDYFHLNQFSPNSYFNLSLVSADIEQMSR